MLLHAFDSDMHKRLVSKIVVAQQHAVKKFSMARRMPRRWPIISDAHADRQERMPWRYMI